MYIVEYMPLWHGRTFFAYISKSGIAGSLSRSISNFQRNLQIDFQSGCTSLQSNQQWRSVHLSPHPLQHVLLVTFSKKSSQVLKNDHTEYTVWVYVRIWRK